MIQAYLLPSSAMTSELLETKLNVPGLRPGLVPRPQLMEKLQAGLAGKLTLVAGPPGFGKTTLVSDWIQRSGRPYAWLSLERADNEARRFLVYLTAALQRSVRGVGERAMALLLSSQPLSAEAALTLLINDFASLPSQTIMVLDDYHLIELLEIHRALAFLLDNLPPQLHVVIVSREDPPLPLHRFRSRGALNGIYVRDLRFTDEEAATFLQQTMKLHMASQDVALLAQRTEGWVAGLQLAALSLKDMHDTSRFVGDFAGDDRYIADYLLNEVIKRQPAHVQEFLLKTAVLDRFSASLCDAVLAGGEAEPGRVERRPPSQAIIDELDQSNLFILSLDNRREWYRYHQLFADFLRRRMNERATEDGAGIHRRAAAWYEENGLFTEAIEQALAGNDFREAARHIEEHALAAIFEQAQWSTLFNWMASLPENTIRARPQLALAFAWALYARGRWLESEPYLSETERAVSEAGERSDRRQILGEVAALRAMVAFEVGDLEHSKALADRALELLPEANESMRSVAALARGMARLGDEDEERTQRLLAEAVAMAQAAGNVTVGLFALGFRIMLAVRQGRLRQAAAWYEQAIALGTVQGNILYGPAGFACVQMGEVLHEWNRLEEAEEVLVQGIRLCQQQSGMPIWIVEGQANLARIKLARGDEVAAEKLMRQAEEQLSSLPEQGQSGQRFVAATHAYRLRYRLARGEVEAARRWLARHGISVDSVISPGEEMIHLLLARALMAGGEVDEAGHQLQRLRPIAEAGTSQRLAVELSILEALQLQAKGAEDEALDTLSRALRESEQEGYVRLFVDYGKVLARLLKTAAEQRGALGVAGTVLAAMDVEGVAGGGVAVLSGALPEPLSDQEERILRLMAAGCTNREIAGELFLSVNTIKVYASRLYGKLDVHRRGEAVARARALGILSSATSGDV